MKKTSVAQHDHNPLKCFLCAEVHKTCNTRISHLVKELMERPTLQKIVDREVLPWFVLPLVAVMCMSAIGIGVGALGAVYKLQTPIEKPYAVYVTRVQGKVTWDKLKAHDKAATESWLEDERIIKKLRRDIQQEAQ